MAKHTSVTSRFHSCDLYSNDRAYSLTCFVNIPAFKRFLVLKNGFFKFRIEISLFRTKILKFDIEIFNWKQDF